MSNQFILRGFNPAVTQQMYSDAVFRQTRQESAGDSGLSALRKASGAVQAADKLLEGLADLLRGAAQAPQGESTPAPVPGIEPDMPPELLDLIKAGADPKSLNLDLRPEDRVEFEKLVKDYQRVLKAIADLDKMLEDLRSGESTPKELLEQVLSARELMASFEDGLIRKLKRQAEYAWYMRWRMTYRDEMETRTNLRREQEDGPIAARSLPDGVQSDSAHAALTQEMPRPDLEHGSQVLQALSNQAPAHELDVDPAQLRRQDSPYA